MSRPARRSLCSTVHRDGTITLGIDQRDVRPPGADEVVVEMRAAPINPSDIGVLLPGLRADSLRDADGDGAGLVADVSDGALAGLGGRVEVAVPGGNEGAGVVVATGSSAAAAELAGTLVAVFAGGGTYGTHITVAADRCLRLNPGTTATEGASCFVNPLTASGMVETMRLDGHRGIVHTAAASQLGQMLQRLCDADGVGLVNVVRRPDQVELLRGLGASHVVDSSADTYRDDLAEAIEATGATVAFDAIGGGPQAGEILAAMEAVLVRGAGHQRYGSDTLKQVHVYGGLDRAPTVIDRSFGMAWTVGGWLLMPFLARVGPEVAARLRQRVADEITTTFATSYSHEIGLDEMLDVDHARRWSRPATNTKYLVSLG